MSCRPCDDVICEVTQDVRTFSIEGLPPLPLPPQPPPTPPAFSNDAVYYDVDCGAGGSPIYEGNLPGWITIDEENSRLVGTPGTFRAATKAAANTAAQSALNAFAVAALGDDTLTCACFEAMIVGTGDFTDDLSGFNVLSLATNGNEAVAVGIDGEIIISNDGTTWESKQIGTGTVLWAVVYGGGVWVAVGDSGTVLTSADRTTWTDHSIAAGILYGVAYGAGLFVAVDDSGRIYSSPTGATWTLRDTAAEPLYNIIFGGGQFVAVGGSGFITTSPDGINWTDQTSGVAIDLYDVAYQSGVFVANSGALTVVYSSDGVTWQDTDIQSTDSSLYAIAGGNGFFATVTQETGQVWVSADGATWTRQLPDLCPDVLMIDYYAGCQFNVSLPYLPESDCSGIYVAWDVGPIGSAVSDIVVNGDFLVSVATTNGGSGAAIIKTSKNGLCWVSRTTNAPAAPSPLWAVAYGNGLYVAVGAPRLVLTSPDGITWTHQPDLGGANTTEVFAVTFGIGIFVAAVNHHAPGPSQRDWEIYTSTNGVAWTIRESESGIEDEAISFLTFQNNTFMALGGLDLIYTSADGITWTNRTVPTSGQTFQESAYGNGVWIVTMDAAVLPEDYVLRSVDNGVTWTMVQVPEQMYSISYGNGRFVMHAAGDSSSSPIYTSIDGLAWTATDLPEGNGVVRYYKDCTFIV